jgi:hypothetical protein
VLQLHSFGGVGVALDFGRKHEQQHGCSNEGDWIERL